MEIGFKKQPDFEYIENDPATWVVRKEQSVPEWFQAELTKLGGLNPHGQPVLRAVWAGNLKSDRTENGKGLKYHCGWTPIEVSGYRYQENGEWQFSKNIDNLPPEIMVIPSVQAEELGLLRFVIEKWTSPQELAYQHRFKQTTDQGIKVLRDFPREGIYDIYLIVETAAQLFRPLDRDVLIYLRYKWNYDQKPIEEQERLREEAEEQARIYKEKVYRERVQAIMDGDLKLPKDEIERREEYWERVHDYSVDEGHLDR